MSYQPLYIASNHEGLIQNRQNFLIPNDAYPVLFNALVWREKIRRKPGYQLLGRLRRVLEDQDIGTTDGSGDLSGNLISILSLETNADFQRSSFSITDGTNTLTDTGTGILTGVPAGSGTINYSTGAFTLTGLVPAQTVLADFNYYPCLPVMGISQKNQIAQNNELTVIFDTKYAYNFSAFGFRELIAGTTWASSIVNANSNFFWTTNYWVDSQNQNLFWATNYSGVTGNPIRYTNATGTGTGSWIDFAPQINAAGDILAQALAMLPFRGRMLAFNTLEGASLALSVEYRQRIRWAAIGNPITTVSTIVTAVNANAWRDDITGQGGFLDIPTGEDIVSVTFVRDNLIIFCENSTWQLRYTGRTVQPFQVEKVNTTLGSGSPFGTINFDDSVMTVGDKGVIECDTYKAQTVDVKIPDLVMTTLRNTGFGQKRVWGARNFVDRIAYWIYPDSRTSSVYPNRRLVFNYENQSWGIYSDSLTALGLFQPVSKRTWANPTGGDPSTKLQWQEAKFSWRSQQQQILDTIGGNQQGYVEFLDKQTTNDQSLIIKGITGNTTTPTVITSPVHNLEANAVIKIMNLSSADPFYASLDDEIFGVIVIDENSFYLMKYSAETDSFSDPQLNAPATYLGGGEIAIRDNFRVVSKKFNKLEEGQNIQMGFLDILMPTTETGEITLKAYVDYENQSANDYPQNADPVTQEPNEFFNTIIPTSAPDGTLQNAKTNHRVYCPIRGQFITLEYTLSNAQMIADAQEEPVEIDMQIIWNRAAGRIGR